MGLDCGRRMILGVRQRQEGGKMETLRRYLAEGRLSTSAKMLAVLGFFCDLALTDPIIESLSLTDEGDVLARPKDSEGLFFIFAADDLRRNLMGACDALAVPADECRMLSRAADRILAESKPAAGSSAALTTYSIGCSIWSKKETPSRNSVRFCCREPKNA
jgi:hypothetical protein